MNAEVITIGTELLLGQITDTNASYLGRKLAGAGVNLYFKTTAGDNIERVKSVLSAACGRADLLIITGGLGPTVDDITREAVAQFIGKPLVLDKAALAKIESMFASRGILMTENNKLQAYIPEGAITVENNNGTAPGFIVEFNSKIIAAMPGVPSEMYSMMENAILPYIMKKTGNVQEVIVSKSLKVMGLGESRVDDMIQDLFKESKNPTIGIYAHVNEIEIRLTAKSKTEKEAHVLIDALKAKLFERLGDKIYGEDEETLEGKIAGLLLEKKMTVSTAESCTSGLVAYRLTNIPGSSAYFKGGINSYANEVKTDVLGVDLAIIEQHGAVSPECAQAMAKAAVKLFRTNCAISVTGVAGPGGGTTEKPVGLVYMCVCIDDKTEVFKSSFPGFRENIRLRTAQAALYHFYMALKGHKA